jgi:hypothetical protein
VIPVQLFVAVLGASNYTYAEAIRRLSSIRGGRHENDRVEIHAAIGSGRLHQGSRGEISMSRYGAPLLRITLGIILVMNGYFALLVLGARRGRLRSSVSRLASGEVFAS